MNKHFLTLEFNKILEQLKNCFILNYNKDNIMKIKLLAFDQIKYALEEVDEALLIIKRYSRFPFYFCLDVKKILLHISKDGIIDLVELFEITKFIKTIRESFTYIRYLKENQINVNYLEKNIINFNIPKNLINIINKTLDDYGNLNDDATETLYSIRRKIYNTSKSIQNYMSELIAKEGSKLSSSTPTIKEEQHVLAVKATYKNSIKGVLYGVSASKETFYIQPYKVSELNNQLILLKEEERIEIYKILSNISNLLKENINSYLEYIDKLYYIDIVFGKAIFALKNNYNKVNINQNNIIKLYSFYHPLLNVSNIVKNNFYMNEDQKCLVVTGSNTGGKTVLLKTIGLFSIMLRYGLFIPASENSDMAIFNNILVDIGDEQDITLNLSTFSSHLKNIVNIVKNIKPSTLVLLDELGTGTDPNEGAALAISIIKYLIDNNTKILLSTHYSELKLFAFSNENIINANMEFDLTTLQPTYKLKIGIPGESYALEIAKILGLPKVILDNANAYIKDNDSDLKLMLRKLELNNKELETQLNKVEEMKIGLENELKQVKIEKELFNQTNLKLLAQAKLEAEKQINQLTLKAYELVEQLQARVNNNALKPHEIIQYKHRIKQLNDLMPNDVILSNQEFKLNDTVYSKSFKTSGIIKQINKNEVLVDIGNLSIILDINDLQHTSIRNKKELAPKKTIEISVNNVSNTLDLRGVRYYDAKMMLDKFIDDAFNAKLTILTIIHGYGTGTIRKVVKDYIKDNHIIKSNRSGGMTEGGLGVTVIEI